MSVFAKVVGNYEYNVPVKAGEKVELKACENIKHVGFTNHIGVFNMNGQQIGSIANKAPRNMVNNEQLISHIGDGCVGVIKNSSMNKKGSFDFTVEIEADVGQGRNLTENELWASNNWSRGRAYHEFGEQSIAGKQGYLGDKAIVVTLGGVDDNPFTGEPQFDWIDEGDGLRKYGFNSNKLFQAIAKIGANSGDKISISNNGEWIVTKL